MYGIKILSVLLSFDYHFLKGLFHTKGHSRPLAKAKLRWAKHISLKYPIKIGSDSLLKLSRGGQGLPNESSTRTWSPCVFFWGDEYCNPLRVPVDGCSTVVRHCLQYRHSIRMFCAWLNSSQAGLYSKPQAAN